MNHTSRRTARNVTKKLIDARNILRLGRSGMVLRIRRPSLVRCRTNSIAAVKITTNTSRMPAPVQCITYYSTLAALKAANDVRDAAFAGQSTDLASGSDRPAGSSGRIGGAALPSGRIVEGC